MMLTYVILYCAFAIIFIVKIENLAIFLCLREGLKNKKWNFPLFGQHSKSPKMKKFCHNASPDTIPLFFSF